MQVFWFGVCVVILTCAGDVCLVDACHGDDDDDDEEEIGGPDIKQKKLQARKEG